ncbi:heavy metal-associated isoprenylated plant protein 34 [Cryptomeria japonica]|uniref:heavy metal-associated isoprenylated plant protein 34 n=1 Tax=Cryptomeria japonica TaxID=3369 RepID=UPI0025AB7648|nr:heavy metal-associated isoprenylated plant protein 34 [Cryptomeria japonica]
MTKNGDVVIKTFVLKVYIHCEGCKKKVKKVLQGVEGVLTTTIDAPEQKVTVIGNVASADILVKRLIKAGKHAEEWPQPQSDAQKDKPKDKEKDKSPPPPPKQKEKKDKEKEKKAAKDEDGEEVPKKGGDKIPAVSAEGAKKGEDPEENSTEGNKGGAGAESSSSGGGKKKKGGKGGGGAKAEPSSEAAEFSGFSIVASGVGGGYGHMSGGGYGGGYGHMGGGGYSHMSNPGDEWMSHAHGMGGASNQPIVQYVQYVPPNAQIYTHRSTATVQNAAYQFNDENAAYAFNDENTGSCSVM